MNWLLKIVFATDKTPLVLALFDRYSETLMIKINSYYERFVLELCKHIFD